MQVELNLPMVAWLQLGYAFQNVPKSRNTAEVNEAMTRIAPQIVELVRGNATPIGRRKDGSKSYTASVDTEVTATLTLPDDDAEIIRDALQSIVDEDTTGEHKWWSVDSLNKANDALTTYHIDFPPGELERILGRPIADGEELSIEIEVSDTDPKVGTIVSIGGKKVAAVA